MKKLLLALLLIAGCDMNQAPVPSVRYVGIEKEAGSEIAVIRNTSADPEDGYLDDVSMTLAFSPCNFENYIHTTIRGDKELHVPLYYHNGWLMVQVEAEDSMGKKARDFSCFYVSAETVYHDMCKEIDNSIRDGIDYADPEGELRRFCDNPCRSLTSEDYEVQQSWQSTDDAQL